MSISLILIGVISVVVIAATAYLYFNHNQELTESKKSTILLVVGTVIFLSFLVTTFKHRDLGFKSSAVGDGALNIKKVFYGDNCQFKFKQRHEYQFDVSREHIEEMYDRNYLSFYDIKDKSDDQSAFMNDYQELIVYLSKKDEGASFFLKDLATTICSDKSAPVIYLDLEGEVRSERDFLRRIGVFSFQQLQRNMCYFSKVDIKVNKFTVEYTSRRSSGHIAPYLIIDNFQYLLSAFADPSYSHPFPSEVEEEAYELQEDNKFKQYRYNGRKRLFDKILKELVGNCQVNIILNTEKEEAIEQLYQLWMESEYQASTSTKDRRGFKVKAFPFEYHRWQGLKQYDIFKIVSSQFPKGSIYLSNILETNKQDKYTFKDLFAIMQEMKNKVESANVELKYETTKEGLFIKQWDLRYNVAKFYGLDKAYRYLKSTENRRISILKTKISLSSLIRLEELGLLEIKDGLVFLK